MSETLRKAINDCTDQTLGRELYELAHDASVWSQATFGADSVRGPIGPLKHLEKEAREAQDSIDDESEYADCLLLVLDAARRAGMGPLALVRAAKAKMIINKQRTWPVPTDDNPVEHLRAD